MDTINKILTFITSRRNWTAAVFFLAPLIILAKPFLQEYLGESAKVLDQIPADQLAAAFVAFAASVAAIALGFIAAVWKIADKLVQLHHDRPATLKDYLDAGVSAAEEIILTVKNLEVEVERLAAGERIKPVE